MKYRIFDSITTDNVVFRLHYKATVVILVAASVLVACIQYFGGAINCVSKDDVPRDALNEFCSVNATFSIADSWGKKIGTEVPYPGIDKYRVNENRVYHTYYRWVSYVLFLQAILFYESRCLWKMVGGGKIRNIISRTKSAISYEETELTRRNPLVEYITSTNLHTFYFVFYVYFEIQNLTHVLSQIFLTNEFLSGGFLTLGVKIRFLPDGFAFFNPVTETFPRMAKCTFYMFGSSGHVQRHEAMCILSANEVIEKIYIFLWFWFIILSFFSLLALIYRVIFLVSPKFRILVIRFRAPMVNQECLESIRPYISLGDWFVLNVASKNLDPIHFRDIVNDLSQSVIRRKLHH